MKISLAFFWAMLAPSFAYVSFIAFASFVSDNLLKVNEFFVLTLIALVVSAGHVIALGVPAVLVYRRYKLISFYSCIGGGFTLAAIPMSFYAWPYKMAIGNGSFSVGGRMLVDNGQLTIYAWLDWLQAILSMGLFGLIGGWAFWVIYKRLL